MDKCWWDRKVKFSNKKKKLFFGSVLSQTVLRSQPEQVKDWFLVNIENL